MGIKVTVEDEETGESNSASIWNDYVIVVAGNTYVAHREIHANGTTVLTIKKDKADAPTKGTDEQ